MELTINGKETEIVFGIAFNRELDMKYKVEGFGLKFGAGLDTVIPELLSDNVGTLADVIYNGTAHIKKGRPSGMQVDKFVEEHEDIEELFDLVKTELEKANATKKKVALWKKDLNLEKE
ncbi:tail assembly chaperone [Lactococcus lactis]|uniref:tail assembly chaperone n=1 Tax=Lactococcus lactis TaxID=1358 RepID=UPI0024182F96|nr:tail assembly chaperone [Lactococcus lactis]MDG4966258.1 tail assembly chaperone [Lactococcus lactis]